MAAKPSVTKTPVYIALAEALRDDIASQKIPPHTRLPSEPELVRRYGAARETVRRALGKLQHDGVVYRRQNVGTFVAEPRVDQDLDQLFSFTEYMMFRGLKPGSVAPGAPAFMIRRLGLSHGVPVEYAIDYYRAIAPRSACALASSSSAFTAACRPVTSISRELVDKRPSTP